VPRSRHLRAPLPRRDHRPPSNASPRLEPHRRVRPRPRPGGSAQPCNAHALRGSGQDPSSNPAARFPFSHPDSDRRRRTTARKRTFTGSTSEEARGLPLWGRFGTAPTRAHRRCGNSTRPRKLAMRRYHNGVISTRKGSVHQDSGIRFRVGSSVSRLSLLGHDERLGAGA
jgi:hypothetical protein